MRTLDLLVGSVLALLAGCSRGADPDPVGELPYCEEEGTPLGLEEASPLGFSGADLLSLAVGAHATTFDWAREGVDDTPLTLVLTSRDGARYIESTAVYPRGGGEQPAIGVVCENRLEVEVAVQLETGDGAFDESWDGRLVGLAADAASTSQVLDPDDLGGDYEMDDDIDEPHYDERSLTVEARFDETGSSGAVRGQISGETPCEDDEDCVAWAQQLEIGSWGGEP